jgi:polysaccharide biosynthesis protein PslG
VPVAMNIRSRKDSETLRQSRAKPWLGALAPLLVVFALVVLPQQSQAHAFGIAAGGGLPWESQAHLKEVLHGTKQLGATWVRFDIDWSVIQQAGPDSFDWRLYDAVVRQARADKLRVLGIIDYTPSWARRQSSQSNKYQPNRREFSSFAARVAKRYGAMGVHDWEIWNEPNLSQFWQPHPDARQYADLLRLTYTKIKKANPKATVIAGSLSNCRSTITSIPATDFVRLMYANGAKGYFDAISIHPYTWCSLPDNRSPGGSWELLSTIHQIMVRHGDGKKRIWITEYGAPTDGRGSEADVGASTTAATVDYVSELMQAMMAREAIALYETYTWVGPFFWYSYEDEGVSTADREDFFGLVSFDGRRKPAYYALQSLVVGLR